MSNLYELLKKIQKRPSMYLGKASITNLRSCLSGYILARRELGIPQTEAEKKFLEFQTCLKQKFSINSGQSWDRIILFFAEDEKNALEHFFDLFEEFLQQQQTELKTKPADVQEQELTLAQSKGAD